MSYFMEIHFGEDLPTLFDYRKVPWPTGETRTVEFYPGESVPVTLIPSNSPDLAAHLAALVDDLPISIDLEWAPDFYHPTNIVELFQFATSRGCLIVAVHENQGYAVLADFLRSHLFFGKGCSCDRRRLTLCCSELFQIEDVELTRLKPNDLPINFEALTDRILGPCCARFKNKKVSVSNWSRRPLTTRQVLYAAHDAIALLKVYRILVASYPAFVPAPPPARPAPSAHPSKTRARPVSFGPLILPPPIAPVYQPPPVESPRARLLKLVRRSDPSVTDEEQCFVDHADRVLKFISTGKREVGAPHVRRVQMAIDLMLLGAVRRRPTGRLRCLPCERSFGDFESLSQHCAQMHAPEALPDSATLDLKRTALRYFVAAGSANCPCALAFPSPLYRALELQRTEEEEDDDDGPQQLRPVAFAEAEGIACRICGAHFGTDLEIERHCWVGHSDAFFQLFAADPQRERDDALLADLGVLCLNRLAAGTVDPRGFFCASCGAKCHSPGSLFAHLFARHLGLLFARRAEHDAWPVVVGVLPERFAEQVRKRVVEIPEEALVEAGVLGGDGTRCLDCEVVFDREDALEHFVEHHLVCFNVIVPAEGKKPKKEEEPVEEAPE